MATPHALWSRSPRNPTSAWRPGVASSYHGLRLPHPIGRATLMAIVKAFDTRGLEEFALNLTEDLGRRSPPQTEKHTDAGKKHEFRVILNGPAARPPHSHEKTKLGIYRTAQACNVFRWKSNDAGCSDAFAEQANKSIVTRIAAK